jgi:uncharacterized protein (TIGR02145 family)
MQEKNEQYVQDIDGNTYSTIRIGNQFWTIENLKTTKYNDGTEIKLVKDNDIWEKISEEGIKNPAYCWYNNDIGNKSKYGALYNWYVVETQKLAPKGWHVPTDDECRTLEEYLISNGYNWDGTMTGNKIAKSLAAKSGWNSSIDIGSIGKDMSLNNRSGFSALPGGFHVGSYFMGIGEYASWWSATRNSAAGAYSYQIGLFLSPVDSLCTDSNRYWADGLSVRLIRND